MSAASAGERFWWLLLVTGLALIPLLAPARADAQRAPADVAHVASDVALPDAPDDYGARSVGDVHWEYPRQASSIAADLQVVYAREWPRVTDELGVDVADGMTIRIGRNPEEMAALAPLEAPPPAYAVGVAYPARGLVLLTLTSPGTNERPDVEAVLVHELSHIALHRAVLGNPTPRWFTEGVAIYQARERSFERTQALFNGAVGGRLMSFERLSAGFPSRSNQVNLAYAQSADFVSWLRARPNGHEKFRSVIRRLRDGQSFQTSLERTYSASMTRLEIDWHDSLAERFKALPLLFGSGTLWVFAAFLILVAYARRKQKDKVKYDEWAEEERRALASAQALLAIDDGDFARAAEPSPTPPDDGKEVLYVRSPEPRGSDPPVPTVEHEGRSHTLH